MNLIERMKGKYFFGAEMQPDETYFVESLGAADIATLDTVLGAFQEGDALRLTAIADFSKNEEAKEMLSRLAAAAHHMEAEQEEEGK